MAARSGSPPPFYTLFKQRFRIHRRRPRSICPLMAARGVRKAIEARISQAKTTSQLLSWIPRRTPIVQAYFELWINRSNMQLAFEQRENKLKKRVHNLKELIQ